MRACRDVRRIKYFTDRHIRITPAMRDAKPIIVALFGKGRIATENINVSVAEIYSALSGPSRVIILRGFSRRCCRK